MAAVVVAAVVAGLFVGARTDVPTRLGLTSDAARSPVAVGAVEEVPIEYGGPQFSLPVLNLSDERIEVSLQSIGGWASPEPKGPSAGLDPGAWGALHFSGPWNCDAPFPEEASSVSLRVLGARGDDDWSAELPQRPAALLEYHTAACASSAEVDARDLSGVWLVEEVMGTRTNLERTQLMRFDADGTFIADADGQLFGPQPALAGTYVLEEGQLDIRITSNRACGRGATSTSRVAMQPGGRLSLAFLSGNCPIEPNGVWIVRRVLADVGLPAQPQ